MLKWMNPKKRAHERRTKAKDGWAQALENYQRREAAKDKCGKGKALVELKAAMNERLRTGA